MGGGGEIALHGQSSKLSSFLSLKDVSTKTINTTTTVQNLTEKMKTKKKNINNTTEKEEEEEREGKQQQQQQQQQQPHRRMRLEGLQNCGTEYCWALDKSGTPCEKKAQKKMSRAVLFETFYGLETTRFPRENILSGLVRS